MHKLVGSLLILALFIPNHTLAEEPYNYAKLWNQWGYESRDAYIEGYYAGVSRAYFKAISTWKPKKEKIEAVRRAVFLGEIKSTIQGVVTDLYKDPSNAYIAFEDMLILARDKINGRDITTDMQNARKHAMENQRVIDEYNLNKN